MGNNLCVSAHTRGYAGGQPCVCMQICVGSHVCVCDCVCMQIRAFWDSYLVFIIDFFFHHLVFIARIVVFGNELKYVCGLFNLIITGH